MRADHGETEAEQDDVGQAQGVVAGLAQEKRHGVAGEQPEHRHALAVVADGQGHGQGRGQHHERVGRELPEQVVQAIAGIGGEGEQGHAQAVRYRPYFS